MYAIFRARRTQDQPDQSAASTHTAVQYSQITGSRLDSKGQVTSTLLQNSPRKSTDVTITIDLPTDEDGPRPDGVKEGGAAGHGESCISGSNDCFHSSLSSSHSLKSNEEAERIRVCGRISSSESYHSDLSGPQSLHSNDEPQKR
ncbi:uncharacterized protein LOC129265293 [Lytechinus pictus]|uniref:uncharacterized protein LOC129265293 n=1 Tax=Lytechinus pictus TaxID=7653 RepID=UPI0030B9C4F9